MLHIQTLGGLSIQLDSEPLTGLDSRKAAALLVYLACTRRDYPREVLSEMFWEERSQTQALSNLRGTLNSLRQKLTSYLDITRETVGINRASPIWLDVTEMQTYQAVVNQPGKQLDVESLEKAAALYQGDFLEGFHIDSQSFDDWALLERERLRFSVTYLLDLLVEEYFRQGATQAGLACTSRLLQIDPLREKTYRQAMRLLAHSSQREAAMVQYDTCQRVLWDELSITPSQETIDLYEFIRSGRVLPIPPSLTPPTGQLSRLKHTLPLQATSFIGRQVEMQELLEQLKDPDCRLLSIVGAGGIGKTRLGLEVARRAVAGFADGVAFVPLASVIACEAIVPAIITALAIPVCEGEHDLQAVLLDYLAERTVLLVLDNMEHLADDLSLIDLLLTSAPQVKLLVTSRQPLNLGWEWQFFLEGMPVPVSIYDEHPDTYSGVRLFVERARHVQRSFQLSDDPAGVIRICQLVEGMPLGIELAAAWLRMMPCHEIAERLVELETPHKPVETRHRSLRALFENTWARLSDHEQKLLMRLSVFRGGFDSDAALSVAQMTLPELAALVNKSLISANYRTNRYDIHHLLNQFMREKLAEHPDEAQQALDAHCAYFVKFLHKHEGALRDHPQALLDIQTDIDNVRAAWQVAVDQHRFDWIVRCCASLNSFYTLKSLHHEALAIFQYTLGVLLLQPEIPERDQSELALQSCLISPLTAVYGWEDHKLWPVAERVRELSQRIGDDRQTLTSLILLLNLYANEGWEKAVEIGQEAVAFSLRMDNQAQMAAYIANEISLCWTGRFSLALEHARAGQARFDPNDCLWGTMVYGVDPLVISLSHAGYTLCLLGYADQGLRTLETALERGKSLNHPFAQAFAWAFFALSFLCIRETSKSRPAGQTLTDLAAEHGFRHWAIFGPGFIGIALIQQGAYEEGIAALLPVLEKHAESGITHNLSSWYSHLAYAYAMTGRLERGLSELERAEELIERVGERLFESLVYRFKGELLLLGDDAAGAEANFEQAIRIAQQQEAKIFELQASLSLCRLLQQQGRNSEAQSRLSAVYNWFTEGFDKPDLVAARALLDELA